MSKPVFKNSDFKIFKKAFRAAMKRLKITDFDFYLEKGDLMDGTIADVMRDCDARSCVVRWHSAPDKLDNRKKFIESVAKHEALHVLVADFSELAHSRGARPEQISAAEEALVVKLCRLID
jgi:hypothetical protein